MTHAIDDGVRTVLRAVAPGVFAVLADVAAVGAAPAAVVLGVEDEAVSAAEGHGGTLVDHD